MLSRRTFIATAVAAAPAFLPRLGHGAGPADRVRVGFIGTGNQGMGLLKRFLAADLGDVVAVCDVNQGSTGYKEPDHFHGREPAAELVRKQAGAKGRRPATRTPISAGCSTARISTPWSSSLPTTGTRP